MSLGFTDVGRGYRKMNGCGKTGRNATGREYIVREGDGETEIERKNEKQLAYVYVSRVTHIVDVFLVIMLDINVAIIVSTQKNRKIRTNHAESHPCCLIRDNITCHASLQLM